jgi:hypothetical protein
MVMHWADHGWGDGMKQQRWVGFWPTYKNGVRFVSWEVVWWKGFVPTRRWSQSISIVLLQCGTTTDQSEWSFEGI